MRNFIIKSGKMFTLGLLTVGVLAGCDSSDSVIVTGGPYEVPTSPVGASSVAKYDPTGGVLPMPNALLFDPTTTFNNFPGSGEPIESMNAIHGFSTSGPILVPFSADLMPATVTGDRFVILEMGTATRVEATVELVNSGSGTFVKILPAKPLKPLSQYIVYADSGLRTLANGAPVLEDNFTKYIKSTTPLVDGSGNSQVSVLDNATAASLERVRLAYSGAMVWEQIEADSGANRASIPVAFFFNTQPVGLVMPQVRTAIVGGGAPLTNPNGTNPVAMGQGTSPGQVDYFYQNVLGLPAAVPNDNIAAIYQAEITVPNFISHPGNGPWAEPPAPVANRQVPAWVIVPNTNTNKTVIYQHGITRTKEDVFAIADSIASTGSAVVAIDLEQHGALSPDLVNNTTLEPGPDGNPDPSGNLFINLANLRMTRDNIRQSVVHLYAVTQALETGVDLNGDGTMEASSASGLHYIGQSLGGIVGGLYAGTEPNLDGAVLNVAGGRLTQLIANSPTFSPRINAGLAANGLNPGTRAYEQFFMIAQTVVDDADVINYAGSIVNGDFRGGTGVPVLLQEAIGDQVVPNSSTRDLALAMSSANASFSQVNAVEVVTGIAQVAGPFSGSGLTQFAGAGHSVLLDPSAGPTVQVVTQALTFLATGAIN